MRLDMTMQHKRPGINNLVPHRQPSGSIKRRQKRIPVPRVLEIERSRLRLDRLGRRLPLPLPGIAADNVRFVAVLVHAVRELDGLGGGPADLEDQVHPGAVFGRESQVLVFGG